MTSLNEEENAEPLSGNELDESEDKEGKSLPEDKGSQSTERKDRGKRRLPLYFVAGLCLMALAGYIYLQNENETKKAPRVYRSAITNDQSIIFELFVIPFKEYQKFTYASLSISFELPNKELMEEMKENKEQLRGIIYDILREEINKIKEFPSLEQIKECIKKGVNGVLSEGEVNEVIITDFLVV